MSKFIKYKLVAIIFGMIFGALPIGALAYDNITTHPALTQEIIKFYNNFYEPRINIQEMASAMAGSTKEDEPAVRTINHFYDPVYQQGLNSRQAEALSPIISILKPFIKSAKEWAQNSLAQATFLGEFYKNAVLNPYARLTQNSIDIATTHTWNKAIYQYINGDKTGAFENLGHVLHLVEDMAVPAHTRNDHHLTGDPYEEWARQFGPANIDIASDLSGKAPVPLNNLDDYFNNLANYSNKNFYSKDTIGIQSGYKEPVSDYIAQIEGQYYAFKIDENGDFCLFFYKVYQGSFLSALKPDVSLQDPLDCVFKNYWSHLSKQAVLYGAGVVHLFFQEVEKDKNNASFLSEMRRTALGDLINSAKDFFSDLFNNKNKNLAVVTPSPTISAAPQILSASTFTSNIPVINPAPTPFYIETATKVIFKPLVAPAPESISVGNVLTTPKPTPIPSPISTPTPTPVIRASLTQIFTSGFYNSSAHTPTPTPIVYCDQNSAAVSDDKPVIINEVAWMGSSNSSNDEWVVPQTLTYPLCSG